MRNKHLLLGTLIVTALIILSFSGCAMAPTGSKKGEARHEPDGHFEKTGALPVKDFESRGLVFTENTFELLDRGTVNGEAFTYQALLKEAQRLGADAIINVVADKKIEYTASGSRETWYGSALAIKYISGTLKDGTTTTTTTPSGNVTVSTEKVIMGGSSGGSSSSSSAGGASTDSDGSGEKKGGLLGGLLGK